MRRLGGMLSLLLLACGPGAGEDAGGSDGGVSVDAGSTDAGSMTDASVDSGSIDGGPDAGPFADFDGGPPIDGCVPEILPSGMQRLCVPFPTGVREHLVPPVEDSYGTRPPPPGTDFTDTYAPTEGRGECSAATHDRYWVRARDGRVYRTWHPPSDVDVDTGEPCHFGHEHGDDPRTSPLYAWAGGVPFGIVNVIADAAGHHRHEDHYGHKVVVQNLYEVIVGNAPDDDPITSAGFHCYWLSKVHQGTHSGDALTHNMHEYQNSIMCDDGFARDPDADWGDNAGPAHHTESSVKTLTFWGQPGWFKACSGLDRLDLGDASDGIEPPGDADTNREIKCADETEGWTFKDFPTEVVSPTGHVDFAPRSAGIDELWKPWMEVTNRDGDTIFTSSAYYVVRNPIRVFNDGTLVPQRDVDGDGSVDWWIPTLEVCLALGRDYGQCGDLPSFPESVPSTEWWRLPQSPFNGTIRVIHPKRIDVLNRSSRSTFCTDYLGRETEDDPRPDDNGYPTCPEGQIFQRVASTMNLWFGRASWGPSGARGGLSGSMVNARSDTLPSGYGHEWVRFFDAPGVHAPN